MELGIDRFVFAPRGETLEELPTQIVSDVLEEIQLADELGIHIYGIGEHHTDEFLDSAPAILLGAAAARTRQIRLTSAIAILGAADPVRVFEEYASLDLVSGGRAEIIAGRGAYAEAFSLFGLDLRDYDQLFKEKLQLLLQLRRGGPITWSGRHRPPLSGQRITPPTAQAALPIWLGATGSPGSFIRAGELGLPLAVGIIGGEFAAYRPLIDLYRDRGLRAGHKLEALTVGVHAIGYVADTREQALEEFFPPYRTIFGELARKVGQPEPTRRSFAQLTSSSSALIVGSPEEVARKLRHIDEVLGGVSRVSLQMSVGPLPKLRRLRSIELLAGKVAELLTS
ncbi:LLM class flavin-dependent oxidoreductase [Rhizobium leguminosarum]|uniref:LLM class flavin-dependent oxidoreductase n=1 Tax=Rhizobium leguminosarum TaxID=384 RepID=UPI000FEC4576|nr:LLM class flavin-dependent oxidoreductase [Rhizobium leguminosarum]RWX12890.1 LLM class flavin-dependent oxidoreductase [Rhizobium leguminosarum]